MLCPSILILVKVAASFNSLKDHLGVTIFNLTAQKMKGTEKSPSPISTFFVTRSE